MRIPTYISRTAPAVVDRGRVSPAETGLPAVQGLSTLSDALADMQLKAQKQVEDTARLSEFVARKDRLSERLSQLDVSLAQDPDPTTYFARAKKGVEEASREALEGVSDPALQRELTLRVAGDRERYLTEARHKAWGLTVDRSRRTLEESIDRQVKEASAATDATAFITALGDIDAAVRGAVKGGIWSEEKGGQIARTAREKIYTVQAEKMADREPDRFLQNYRDGLYRENVDPQRLEEIRRYAQTRNAVGQAEAGAQEIWRTHGPRTDEDPLNEDLMARAIEAKFSDRPEVAKLAIASLKEKAYARDKGVKERRDANLSSIWKAALSGTPVAGIIALPEYSALDGNSQRLVKEHLEDRAWMMRQRAEQDPVKKAAQHELFWRYSQPEVIAGMSENNITALYPSLGVELTDRLVQARRALENPKKMSEAKMDQDDFNHFARQAGIPPEEKKSRAVLGEIKYSVENAIEAEQSARGRALTRKEKAEIMKRGLTEVQVRVPVGLFGISLGTGQTTKRLFDVQYPGNIIVPPDAREKITADLLARGLPATEENIRNLYIELQVR